MWVIHLMTKFCNIAYTYIRFPLALQTETQTFFQRFSPAVEEQRVEEEKEREKLKPNLKPRKDMESFRLAFNVSGSEAPEIDDEFSPLTPVREETTAT